MPNTKSAERRVRGNERKRLQNRAVKTRLKSLHKSYQTLVTASKKEEATKAYRALSSALDKAAKVGVIPKGTAQRKRSRLALALAKVK
ncbi:MAG: 30S ribosomal protein S20 [Verrucomicrobiota bacterium]